MARKTLRPASRVKFSASQSITPVRSRAALSTNIAPIVIGAELLKRFSILSEGRTPVTKTAASAPSAMRSGDPHSRMKATKTPSVRSITKII